MRALNLLMAALFAFAALVQVNDPDPLRWVAMYVAACALSIWFARGPNPAAPWNWLAPALLGTVALAWAAVIMLGGPASGAYVHMFDTWEMKDEPVEEAREATGLLIVAAWMMVLRLRSRARASF